MSALAQHAAVGVLGALYADSVQPPTHPAPRR